MHGVRREWFEDGSLKSEETIEFGWLMKKAVHNERHEVVELYERPETDPKYQEILEWRRRGKE